MNTTAMGRLPRFACVVVEHLQPAPRASSCTCDSGTFLRAGDSASVSCSPVTITSRFSRTGRLSCAVVEPGSRAVRCRGVLGSYGSPVVSDQAEFETSPSRRARRMTSCGSCTPGSCTTMRSRPWRVHDRLGHAELVDAIAQRRDVLLDRVVLAFLDLLRREPRDQRWAQRRC